MMLYPLLFCASSHGKFNIQEWSEVSAMHLQFHTSTTVDTPVPPHSYLNTAQTLADQTLDRWLRQHKAVKSRVLFNRALRGKQTNTLKPLFAD